MDYASLVEDTGRCAHQDSLRGIVNYVLGEIGTHSTRPARMSHSRC